MRSEGLNKVFEETAERFYACTYLPIAAFTSDGKFLYGVGLTGELTKTLEDTVYDLAWAQLPTQPLCDRKREGCRKKRGSRCACHHTTLSVPKVGEFAARYLCPGNPALGLFILGPYTTQRSQATAMVTYRPADCVPHLMVLLGRSYKGVREQLRDSDCYSFHVQRAVEYILSNYQGNITLEFLSDYLGINKSYLSTLFKQETGQTFSQFLNSVRVEQSKKHLQEKDTSILDVALTVGFSNQNYYGTIFKRLTGMTPSEYRIAGEV